MEGNLEYGYLDGYNRQMTSYSVAEARDNLSRLIAEAERGEPVSIKRRGEVVVDLVPRKPASKGAPLNLAWLDAQRVSPKAGPIDSAAGVEEMRRGYRY